MSAAASTAAQLRHISYAEAEQRLASDDSKQTLFLLIRHAESVWNVWEQLYEGKEPLLFDALFSPNGQQQLQQTRAVVHTLLKGRLPDVLVLSPLSRAIETDSCDVGTPPAVLKQRYPELDVEQLSRLGNHWFLPGRLHEEADRGAHFDGDVWAYQTACWALVQEHGAETEAEMAERLRDFVAYLSTLNGKHRVVVAVGHGNALWTLTEHHAAEHPADDWYFRNCEVRAFVLEEK